ncbi:hypothetical protein FB451DRAFT_1392043 [Mycena latifolia]|nr:hypothetical protein FB451DRAFT_1392043 [Mycena latifolia]
MALRAVSFPTLVDILPDSQPAAGPSAPSTASHAVYDGAENAAVARALPAHHEVLNARLPSDHLHRTPRRCASSAPCSRPRPAEILTGAYQSSIGPATALHALAMASSSLCSGSGIRLRRLPSATPPPPVDSSALARRQRQWYTFFSGVTPQSDLDDAAHRPYAQGPRGTTTCLAFQDWRDAVYRAAYQGRVEDPPLMTGKVLFPDVAKLRMVPLVQIFL